MTRTFNGVTESVWKRTDAEGNEHVTRTLPDGREIYTVNGLEQALPAPAHQQALPPQYASEVRHDSDRRSIFSSRERRLPFVPDTTPAPGADVFPENQNRRSSSNRLWWRR